MEYHCLSPGNAYRLGANAEGIPFPKGALRGGTRGARLPARAVFWRSRVVDRSSGTTMASRVLRKLVSRSCHNAEGSRLKIITQLPDF